jgi:O-antigen/teichoic acid export membrane protein
MRSPAAFIGLHCRCQKSVETMRRFLRGEFKQQVGATFLRQVVGLVLAIGSSAIIARWLGREGKGVVALASLLPGMIAILLGAGIGAANVYFAGSRRLSIATLSGNSMAFGLLGSSAGIAVVIALHVTGSLRRLVPGVPIELVFVGMLWLPLTLVTNYFRGILTGLRRIIPLHMVGICLDGMLLLLTLLMVAVLRIGPLGGLLASLGTGVAGLVALGILLRREGGVFSPRWEGPVVRATLGYGVRGHIGSLLQFFNYRFDVFIVNYFLGPACVGVYGVSVGLAELLWYLPNAVGFVIFPKAAASKPEEMNAFTPRVFRLTLLLTAFGGGGLALFARPLIKLIYSSAFVGAYAPMLMLLPGVVLLGGGKVLTNEIAGRGFLTTIP